MKRGVCLSDFRSYRDDVSKEYMKSLGVDTGSDDVVPDLVFGFPREWIKGDRAPSSPPKIVGVGLMGYYGWKNDRKSGRGLYRAYIDKMAQFVSWLLGQGFRVRLLIGERQTDDRAVSDLIDVLKGVGMIDQYSMLESASIDSVDGVFSEINRTDLVVASRYHNIVCALALSRPVLSIGYASKFEALMKDMGLGRYCQHIEELSVQDLKGQFLSLAADHALATRQITERCEGYRRRLDALYDSTFRSA
jgi:polysaccharide pyruvyl transferase WcaK-like protein